jgi:isoaspartyl peptidase/L-asparaginase-like protein (Ntn-hydrolase superfamily)
MSFEDNGYTYLRVQFQQSTNLVARFAAIVESDGKQGFVEDVVSDSDFLITNQMTNHHAGVFGDTPMPDLGTHLEPAITSPEKGHTSAWHKTWASAGHWVASAAGWLWKHRGEVYNAARAGSAIYRNLTSFAGSITGMGNGEIMSLPARAAPLLLAAP